MNKTLACNKIENLELVKQEWSPAMPTVVFDTYWRFAAERQAIFFRRIKSSSGYSPPSCEADAYQVIKPIINKRIATINT